MNVALPAAGESPQVAGGGAGYERPEGLEVPEMPVAVELPEVPQISPGYQPPPEIEDGGVAAAGGLPEMPEIGGGYSPPAELEGGGAAAAGGLAQTGTPISPVASFTAGDVAPAAQDAGLGSYDAGLGDFGLGGEGLGDFELGGGDLASMPSFPTPGAGDYFEAEPGGAYGRGLASARAAGPPSITQSFAPGSVVIQGGEMDEQGMLRSMEKMVTSEVADGGNGAPS